MKHTEVKPRKGYIAYTLNDQQRNYLLSTFEPLYSKVIAHHVTWKFGVTDEEVAIANQNGMFEVVGEADSGDGLQALVVQIDDSLERPDGGTFHITWSLEPTKYKPVDSNKLIAEGTWNYLDNPVMFNAEAQFIPFQGQ